MFNQEHYTQWQFTAAGSIVLFVLMLILFLCTQHNFVREIVTSGMK